MPEIRATTTTLVDDFAKLRQVIFAWHSPAMFAEGDAELDIAAAVLEQEGPGRLYRALVYDRPLAQRVEVAQSSSQFSSDFEITVTLRSEASLDEVKRIVAAEVGKLAAEPVSAKEIARFVAKAEALAVRRLESVLGRADQLQRYNHYLGDPDKLSWDLDRYRKTTPEKIRAAVAKYLRPDRMIEVITMPSAAPAAPASPASPASGGTK